MKLHDLPLFTNEPFKDFNDPATRHAMVEAIGEVRSQLGATCDLVIGGRRTRAETTFASVNPARPGEVVFLSAKEETRFDPRV